MEAAACIGVHRRSLSNRTYHCTLNYKTTDVLRMYQKGRLIQAPPPHAEQGHGRRSGADNRACGAGAARARAGAWHCVHVPAVNTLACKRSPVPQKYRKWPLKQNQTECPQRPPQGTQRHPGAAGAPGSRCPAGSAPVLLGTT